MKLLKKIKLGHIIAFVVGAVLFGGIGVVVATNIASSTVDYITGNNANVQTVEDALDDLYDQIVGHPITCYNGTCGKLSYKYWNDGFDSTTYQSNALPTTNYATRALLEQNYGSSSFASNPFYIRSVLIDGNVVGHQACVWYNNKEFCLAHGYWAGTLNTSDENAGTQTKIKLQRDMQLGLTIQETMCESASYSTLCIALPIYCGADSDGGVHCRSSVVAIGCNVDGDGSAECN